MTSQHLRFDPDGLIDIAATLDHLAATLAGIGSPSSLTPPAAGRDEVSVAVAEALSTAAGAMRGDLTSGADQLARIAAALRQLATGGTEADSDAALALAGGNPEPSTSTAGTPV